MATGWWSRNGHHDERGRQRTPPNLIALVRAGAVFKNGKVIERPDESEGDDQHVA
jgi:hypothetical protein